MHAPFGALLQIAKKWEIPNNYIEYLKPIFLFIAVVAVAMQAKAPDLYIFTQGGVGSNPIMSIIFFHFLWWFLIQFALFHDTNVLRAVLDHFWFSVQVH